MRCAVRKLGRSRVRRAARRGVAVVEFAFICPLLLILMLGILEAGRLFMVRQSLILAAREGARTGASLGVNYIDARVDAVLANAGLADAEVSYTPNSATAPSGTPITVTVAIPFHEVSWLPPKFIRDFDVTAAATMRKP